MQLVNEFNKSRVSNPAVLISMQSLVDIRVNHFKIPVGKDHKEITYVPIYIVSSVIVYTKRADLAI